MASTVYGSKPAYGHPRLRMKAAMPAVARAVTAKVMEWRQTGQYEGVRGTPASGVLLVGPGRGGGSFFILPTG